MTDKEELPQEERDRITADEILIKRGLAERGLDGRRVYTTKGQAAQMQQLSDEDVIKRFAATDHLQPDQFPE